MQATNTVTPIIKNVIIKPSTTLPRGLKEILNKLDQMSPCERKQFLSQTAKTQQKIREQEERVYQEREKEKRIQTYLNAIPDRYIDTTFEDYLPETDEEKKALNLARKYVMRFSSVRKSGTNMIFSGTCGNGKTLLAWSIFKGVIQAGYTAEFKKAKHLLAEIRRCFDRKYKDAPSAEDVILKYAKVDLLIVDEVGKQDEGESARRELFDLIDMRFDYKRPLICISNEGVDGLKHYLGEAGYSRVLGHGGVSVVFTGRDRRLGG